MENFLNQQPYFFPLFFVAMWIAITKMISLMGGWNSLAGKYRLDGDFDGQRWHMQSARIGWSNYSGCLTFGVNQSSLYMNIFFLFKIGHPKLLIPLTDLIGKENKIWIFKHVTLTFRELDGIKVKISGKLADQIEQASNGSWKYGRI